VKNLPNRFRVQITIEADGNGFHAYCPALKGLHVCGDTREEARQNAKDAIIAYLKTLIKHNLPIPIGIIETLKEESNKKTETEDLVLV